ncbi:hypothetical protein GYH30_030981 [Glycine max]|nr:hypothetical protein GYH30_030981 [Glycine max]
MKVHVLLLMMSRLLERLHLWLFELLTSKFFDGSKHFQIKSCEVKLSKVPRSFLCKVKDDLVPPNPTVKVFAVAAPEATDSIRGEDGVQLGD